MSTSNTDMRNLTQQQAAYLLGITARTLRDWSDAPRNPDRSYDGQALVRWMLERDPAGEYEDQRQRLAAAQAEKVERENLVRAGELIEVPEVVRGWGEHIAAARAKLLAMPMKLGPQMLNITDAGVAAGKIRVEVHAALTELAQWKP